MVQLEFCNKIKQLTISTDNIFDPNCFVNLTMTSLPNSVTSFSSIQKHSFLVLKSVQSDKIFSDTTEICQS